MRIQIPAQTLLLRKMPERICQTKFRMDDAIADKKDGMKILPIRTMHNVY